MINEGKKIKDPKVSKELKWIRRQKTVEMTISNMDYKDPLFKQIYVLLKTHKMI